MNFVFKLFLQLKMLNILCGEVIIGKYVYFSFISLDIMK